MSQPGLRSHYNKKHKDKNIPGINFFKNLNPKIFEDDVTQRNQHQTLQMVENSKRS